MAYRIFPAGQVPTAQVLQKYLMDQAVITCVSTARPPTPVEGMVVFETDTGNLAVWYDDVWVVLAAVGGAPQVRFVKGKVFAGSLQTTNISTSSDTNIAGANLQNVPVIAGRAYRLLVAFDYKAITDNEPNTSRMEVKAWNGSVGGTQLGGTYRYPQAELVTETNARTTGTMGFIWKAPATETIANLNISVTCGAAGWQIELNQAFWATVEELGPASLITNL